LVSQLNNYTLAPISGERGSEAARGELRRGVLRVVVRVVVRRGDHVASLSFAFTSLSGSSTVLAPAEQQQVAAALEADAEVMSNTQLEEQLVGQPPETKAEIIRITPTPGRWHGRSPC
jgi:hypothetical protein